MAPLTDNLRGALFMTGSMSAFVINDAFLKLLGQDYPFFQLIFLRSLGVTILLGVMAARAGALRMPEDPRDRKLIAMRTVFEVFAAWCFITAFFNMPLADATAILQALPLTVTLGAALFFREPVGWRRMMAIIIGFIGVMLIVQPGGSGFSPYAFFALAAVFLITGRDLAVRGLSQRVPSLTVAFVTALGLLVFGAIGGAFTEWRPMAPLHYVYLSGAVVAVMGGYLLSVMAMRVGEIGAVTPFRYTSLLAALVVGLLVFGEWPNSLTILGAIIVVGTGLFTIWRERKLMRANHAGIRPR